jgi:DNA-binding response OmpR family regulator
VLTVVRYMPKANQVREQLLLSSCLSVKRNNRMKSSGTEAARVLVVEDEAVISRICSQTLRGEGFTVDIVANGSLAQGKLEEKEYDLVIIDIRTPVMNGKQLYQSILERYPKVVSGVIFTTGDLLGGDTKRFLEQSGRLFLPKPFTPDELKSIVGEALRRIGK